MTGIGVAFHPNPLDAKPIGELVRRYDQRLLNFVYRTIGDRERAQDLVQDLQDVPQGAPFRSHGALPGDEADRLPRAQGHQHARAGRGPGKALGHRVREQRADGQGQGHRHGESRAVHRMGKTVGRNVDCAAPRRRLRSTCPTPTSQ